MRVLVALVASLALVAALPFRAPPSLNITSAVTFSASLKDSLQYRGTFALSSHERLAFLNMTDKAGEEWDTARMAQPNPIHSDLVSLYLYYPYPQECYCHDVSVEQFHEGVADLTGVVYADLDSDWKPTGGNKYELDLQKAGGACEHIPDVWTVALDADTNTPLSTKQASHSESCSPGTRCTCTVSTTAYTLSHYTTDPDLEQLRRDVYNFYEDTCRPHLKSKCKA